MLEWGYEYWNNTDSVVLDSGGDGGGVAGEWSCDGED